MSILRHETLSIHGRFQVFHNNHLTYLKNAVSHCPDAQELIIGITQPDITALAGDSDYPAHRSISTENPLTYEQRKEMISCVMREDSELSGIRYSIVPFPIEDTTVDLSSLIPTDTIMALGFCDEWSAKKIGILASRGYSNICIVSNDSSPDRLSGTTIRDMIRSDDEAWIQLVPKSVSSYLYDVGLMNNIKSESS